MALRLTDTEKWGDPWFRELPTQIKLLWVYLCDKCDHAGIWKVDQGMVNFIFGQEVDLGASLELLNSGKGRISPINGGSKWFIRTFIDLQYKGELNPDNRCHRSVLKALKKEGVSKGLYKPLRSPCEGRKDKVKDKDNKDFNELWSLYPSKVGKRAAERHFWATVKTAEDLKNIKIALNNYLGSERVKKGFIQNGSTWFNDWQGWVTQKPKDGLDKWLK